MKLRGSNISYIIFEGRLINLFHSRAVKGKGLEHHHVRGRGAQVEA